MCASLDILLHQLDLNTPLISDIKNNNEKLQNIFLNIIKKNDYNINETLHIENIKLIIDHFIFIIINIIVYKNKKDKNSILTTYQFYVFIFRNNLSDTHINKLNINYNTFKEYCVNNIINNHFKSLNFNINNLIEKSVLNII